MGRRFDNAAVVLVLLRAPCLDPVGDLRRLLDLAAADG